MKKSLPQYIKLKERTVLTSILLLLFSSTISSLKCKKSNDVQPELPPITQEGKNTFGCKVNGKVWVPFCKCEDRGFGKWEMTTNAGPVNQGSAFPFAISIGVQNHRDMGGSFIIGVPANIRYIYGPGNVIDSLSIDYTDPHSGKSYYSIQGFSSADRYFTITKLDTINKIVSGIFSFPMYSSTDLNHADSVQITEGRFDIQFGLEEKCTP